jgi:miniconductance mechanosensitive channel
VIDRLSRWVEALGLEGSVAQLATYAASIAIVLSLAWLADLIMRRLVLRGVVFAVRRSDASWDDVLIHNKVFRRAGHVAPAIVLYVFASAFPEIARGWIERLSLVWMILITALTIDALLDSAVELYERTDIAAEKPILGYVQVAKIVFWVIGGVFMIATVLQKEPWGLLTGLGALSAVLLLIFRDSILGFVAGIQIALNDLVRRGDWIEMPSHNVDGDVIDISLHTVKVQNWDKTISTIPVHHMVTDSFRNWRGMSESGGRRIKRAVLIDIDSIRFCDDPMLERFSRYQYMGDYLHRKREEIRAWNEENDVDTSVLVNGRRLTNVGVFRAYLELYLRHHPMIHKGMTFLVRQLSPTREGLPIEIYVFSKDQDWVRYEALQADIFDHVLAAAREFDLRIAQDLGGGDLQDAARQMARAAGAEASA